VYTMCIVLIIGLRVQNYINGCSWHTWFSAPRYNMCLRDDHRAASSDKQYWRHGIWIIMHCFWGWYHLTDSACAARSQAVDELCILVLHVRIRSERPFFWLVATARGRF